MHWLIFCVLVQLLTPAVTLSCGAGYSSWDPAADVCTRVVALMVWKPSLASVATRNATGIGSTPMPVYSALGGPNGKGHVTFDRLLWQYMNTGQCPFNMASNGGFTVVAVVRFRGAANVDAKIIQGMEGENEIFSIYQYDRQYIRIIVRVVEVFWGLLDMVDLLSHAMTISSTNFMNITLTFKYSNNILCPHYMSENCLYTHISIDDNVRWEYTSGTPPTDTTLTKIVVGGHHDTQNNNHFNGDIAGLFVTDEVLSSNAITQVYNNIWQGIDLTTT